MNDVVVIIPGEPVGQGRPRAAVINGRARIYSPKNSDAWRGYAATLMREACPKPFIGPVNLSVIAVFALPKSKHKKRNPVKETQPCMKKPDFDNIAKAVGDAGNGILWVDDSQITSAHVRKEYAAQGDPPYVAVYVTELP